jgi:hypothetical protein
MRLKMEVFPADSFSREDISGFIDELVRAGLLRRFMSQGVAYLVVTGWKHQKIDKPTYRFPRPPFDEGSPNGSGGLDEPSPPEGNGRESNIEHTMSQPPTTTASKAPEKPQEYTPEFEAFWGAVAPHKRKSKAEAAKRYREAVPKVWGRPGVFDPHQWLRKRAAAYYGSPLGQTPYCHGPAPWLHQGGYDDDPAAWERPGDASAPHEPVDEPYPQH